MEVEMDGALGALLLGGGRRLGPGAGTPFEVCRWHRCGGGGGGGGLVVGNGEEEDRILEFSPFSIRGRREEEC